VRANRRGRGFLSWGSIYLRHIAAMPRVTLAAGLASALSSETQKRSQCPTTALTRRRAFSHSTNYRRGRAATPSGNAPERFPQNYHEPYYGSYIGEDFSAIARRFGLMHERDVTAFVSKVMVFDKS
jgi:hypothetical protein